MVWVSHLTGDRGEVRARDLPKLTWVFESTAGFKAGVLPSLTLTPSEGNGKAKPLRWGSTDSTSVGWAWVLQGAVGCGCRAKGHSGPFPQQAGAVSPFGRNAGGRVCSRGSRAGRRRWDRQEAERWKG